MGYDLVTWQPNGIGGFAEWQYHWHSALSKFFEWRIFVGKDDYSDPPTIAEINARTGLNQVVALYNRRASLFNSDFGTALVLLDYFQQDEKILASDWQLLKDSINYLRQAEGFSVFSFTPTISNNKIQETFLIELRKSLAITGEIQFKTRAFFDRLVFDNPYLTRNIATLGNDSFIGKAKDALRGGADMLRQRSMRTCLIPKWVGDIGDPDGTPLSGWLELNCANYTEFTAIEPYNGLIILPNEVAVPGTPSTSDFGDSTTSIASGTFVAASVINFPLISFSEIKALAGSVCGLILATKNEQQGAGTDFAGPNNLSGLSPSGAGRSPELFFDYGDYPTP